MQRLTGNHFDKVSGELLAFAERQCAGSGSAIGFIPEDGVAKVLQVRPDLVSPAGMEGYADQRKVVEVFGHLVIGDRVFAFEAFIWKVGHYLAVFPRPADIGFDRAGWRIRYAPGDCLVDLFDLTPGELRGETVKGRRVLGDDDQP